jgi:hypothetical protein
MDCYYCYRDLRGLIPDVEYDIILGSPVCTVCVERAKAEHGPGWQARARAGCYAGGRPDPRLLDRTPARGVSLTDILLAYTETMGGAPVARPLAEFGSLPPFAAFGQVVYNRFVPRGMMLLYGGRKAGQSAIIYHDLYAHREHRWRIAMRPRLAAIDAALDAVQAEMHKKLDMLMVKVDGEIDDVIFYYRLDFDDQGRRWLYTRRGRSITWHGHPMG